MVFNGGFMMFNGVLRVFLTSEKQHSESSWRIIAYDLYDPPGNHGTFCRAYNMLVAQEIPFIMKITMFHG